MLYTNISGIPCQAKVTFFEKTEEGFDIEFSIYDRRGYKAAWLERKMTEADRSRIRQEIINYYNQPEPY